MSYRDLTTKPQYNEPLRRSELLGTHGVGSLKLTTWGIVMPRAIEKWPLLKTLLNGLKKWKITDQTVGAELADKLNTLDTDLTDLALRRVNDPRFVRFLQQAKRYDSLRCLVEVPPVELNRFNQFKSTALRDETPPSAVHFPRYFYDNTGEPTQRHLRPYNQALDAFSASLNLQRERARYYFVPPRSARRPPGPVPAELAQQTAARDLLEPVPLLLICPHGHISDIPWAKYLHAQTQQGERANQAAGAGLYPNLFDLADCCPAPALLWQSSGRTSDSLGGVQLRCASCQKTTNLSSVSFLRPRCPGHRPWVGAEQRYNQACSQDMQYAQTTGTNLYFPLGYAGIYLPLELVKGATPVPEAALQDAQRQLAAAQEFSPDVTPEVFWQRKGDRIEHDHQLGPEARTALEAAFLGWEPPASAPAEETPSEQLKREEYEVFTQEPVPVPLPDFKFVDVSLATLGADDPATADPTEGIWLAQRLARARRVDELRLTKVQLAFTRVQGLDPDLDFDYDEPDVTPAETAGETARPAPRRNAPLDIRPQPVHSTARDKVLVLPALTNYGEGIFLELDLARVAEWEYREPVRQACERLRPNPALNPVSDFYHGQNQLLSPRRLLVHTLAHLLIRELEWKCGYPAASLSERIYAQPGQAGLLLYATEGSQGSMGGLTHQARPAFLGQLLRQALTRALDCPADPICWNADSQAGTALVQAACFACAMTAETSCELQNTLLDRRLLVDPAYGYFSNWFSA